MPASHGLPGDLVQFRAPLFVLLALVGVVLLIACANLAGLSLGPVFGYRVIVASLGCVDFGAPQTLQLQTCPLEISHTITLLNYSAEGLKACSLHNA
jgi:hypothetical protein